MLSKTYLRTQKRNKTCHLATAISKHVGDCYFESLSEILMRKKNSASWLMNQPTLEMSKRSVLWFGHKQGSDPLLEAGADDFRRKQTSCQRRSHRRKVIRGHDEVIHRGRRPLQNIVGFLPDGCKTMMGRHNSVSRRLRNDLPGITINRCICHSLHLWGVQAASSLVWGFSQRHLWIFYKQC